MTDMTTWERTTDLEWLSDSPTLTSIKENALQAIMVRQMPNGLLCTWREDASSWLYGQGLALKLLSQEGKWIGSTSQNQPAEVAGKLARFLSAHQDAKGFWPRAWNATTGNLRQYLEDDSTVWFGDFPWIITGLQNYYLKSSDQSVKPAIDKALAFLKNLVDTDGQLFTQNMLNGKKQNSVFNLDTEDTIAAIDPKHENYMVVMVKGFQTITTEAGTNTTKVNLNLTFYFNEKRGKDGEIFKVLDMSF